MRNNIAIRNILTAVCGVLLFISTALAIVFSAESVFTRAQTDGWSVSLSLRNDLVLKIDAAESVDEITVYVRGENGEELNKQTVSKKTEGVFEYHGVTPQLMANEVVITTDGAEENTVTTSVKDYCTALLGGEIDAVALDGHVLHQPAVHLLNKSSVISFHNLLLGHFRENQPVEQQYNQDAPQESHVRIYLGGSWGLLCFFHVHNPFFFPLQIS